MDQSHVFAVSEITWTVYSEVAIVVDGECVAKLQQRALSLPYQIVIKRKTVSPWEMLAQHHGSDPTPHLSYRRVRASYRGPKPQHLMR
jgi:hypothetical protein